MKNYSSQALAPRSNQPNPKQAELHSKTYSPTHKHPSRPILDYQNIANQAKQQLRSLQKNQTKQPLQEYRPSYPEQLDNQKTQGREQVRQSGNHKTLTHQYSQKYFRSDEHGDRQHRLGKKEERRDKLSVEGKFDSPKKKNHYIDVNQYKKLHEKLDNIQSKISDLKRNLQKKKKKDQSTPTETDKPLKLGLKSLVTQMPERTELHTFANNPYSPRHNIYYVSELVRAYKDERSLAREHLNTTLNILKLIDLNKKPTDQHIRKMAVKLNRKEGYEGKKTLVFDLDQTLIHCNDSTNVACDVKLPIKFMNGEVVEAGINIRPYAREILRALSKNFEIIVFTASHSCYANVVIDYLDEKREWVHHRLFREHCLLSGEGMYIKDLRIINRDLKDMVLIDNAAYSYAYQLSNGVPILPYYHGQIDFELKKLEDYLLKLIICKDVREQNEKVFKLSQYKHFFGQPEALVQNLYLQK